MNHCIFRHICQYAQYNDTAILSEKELQISNKNDLKLRKLATKSQQVQDICGDACPIGGTVGYLLEKNGLYDSDIFSKVTDRDISIAQKVVDRSVETCELVTYVPKQGSSKDAADLLTYYSICTRWRGSGMKTVVFNLNLPEYIDAVKNDFGTNSSAELTKAEKFKNIIDGKIESTSKNILIVSGLDFINFTKDFPCETLFSIISSRDAKRLPLIVVSPQFSNLMGGGPLFSRLTEVLGRHKVTDV